MEPSITFAFDGLTVAAINPLKPGEKKLPLHDAHERLGKDPRFGMLPEEQAQRIKPLLPERLKRHDRVYLYDGDIAVSYLHWEEKEHRWSEGFASYRGNFLFPDEVMLATFTVDA